MLALAFLTASCTMDGYSEYERTSVGFMVSIGGEIDPSHLWRAAAEVSVTVKSPDSTTVRAYVNHGNDLYLADMKKAGPNGTVSLTVPQGFENAVKITVNNGEKSQTRTVDLTGALTYSTTIDINAEKGEYNSQQRSSNAQHAKAPIAAPAKALVNPIYNGPSIIGKGYYTEWDVQDWLNVALLARGCANPATIPGEVVDYELLSNGPFQITFIGGYKGYMTPHILGYYYHSPGTYEDITFVDLADTHSYSYLDNLCMVQYQLDDIDVWHNASYNILDKFDSPDCIKFDIFNSLLVAETYFDRITKTRGLTFPIDVPAGMKVGFYLREERTPYPAQYSQLVDLGFPKSKIGRDFRATNFSAQILNIDGTHRSWIKNCGHYTFMGMEDNIHGGDFDCNDVMFGFTTASVDIELPDIIEPEIDYIRPADPLSWTIAYEDAARGTDFDFNDAVIRLTPDYENETMCVAVLAAGCKYKMYLHYDGPDGDINLGEIHDLLGFNTHDVCINTITNTAKPSVEIDCVKWPKSFSIETDARRFYIEIIRGTCQTCSDIISLPTTPGQMPQALLIPGNWLWPREGVHITNAYPSFGDWCQDNANLRLWPWHAYPTPGACVTR